MPDPAQIHKLRVLRFIISAYKGSSFREGGKNQSELINHPKAAVNWILFFDGVWLFFVLAFIVVSRPNVDVPQAVNLHQIGEISLNKGHEPALFLGTIFFFQLGFCRESQLLKAVAKLVRIVKFHEHLMQNAEHF